MNPIIKSNSLEAQVASVRPLRLRSVAPEPGTALTIPESVSVSPSEPGQAFLQLSPAGDAAESARNLADSAAQAEARAELERSARLLQNMTERLLRFRNRLQTQAAEQAIELALAIAARLARRELAQNPAVLRAILTEALGQVQPQLPVQIHLHPDDLQALQAAQISLPNRPGNVEWIADERLLPGDCLLQTPRGAVDARLQSQLEQLDRALGEHIEQLTESADTDS